MEAGWQTHSLIALPFSAALILAAPQAAVPESPPTPGTEWMIGKTVAEVRKRLPADAGMGLESAPTSVPSGFADVELPSCRMTMHVTMGPRDPVVRGTLALNKSDGFLSPDRLRGCIASLNAAP